MTDDEFAEHQIYGDLLRGLLHTWTGALLDRLEEMKSDKVLMTDMTSRLPDGPQIEVIEHLIEFAASNQVDYIRAMRQAIEGTKRALLDVVDRSFP